MLQRVRRSLSRNPNDSHHRIAVVIFGEFGMLSTFVHSMVNSCMIMLACFKCFLSSFLTHSLQANSCSELVRLTSVRRSGSQQEGSSAEDKFRSVASLA